MTELTPQPIKSANAELEPDAAVGRVCVVIVNWNSGKWLQKCLASISAYGGEAVDQVIVVDNGSSDGSDQVHFPELPLSVIRAGQNLGFGKACNLGASHADAPYLLFLNPDAALREGTVQSALSFMGGPSAKQVAVCGIRLEDEREEIQHHTTSFPKARYIYRHYEMVTPFDHRESRFVDHVIGAFYLIRRHVFESVGRFDERFFVYFEDVDLSLRVHDAGWKIFYLAEAVAFHKGGGTSDRVKAHRLFYSMRSRTLYGFKHFPPVQAWLVAIGFLFVEPAARLGRGILRRSAGEIVDTLRGTAWFWSDFPSIIRLSRTKQDSASNLAAGA